uniref:Uncharacterized protein n=1 Tax=Trepomonas sp. PC1 TaxID=1076344 RepID=A0A146K6A3_9EUKA|eukprot:JAP91938.1 Hypothetical protein TPC1_16278 [Trepomonas sp. PC1]
MNRNIKAKTLTIKENNRLFLLKKKIEAEIKEMELIDQEYQQHTEFYNKLIAFAEQVKELKASKSAIENKNEQLSKMINKLQEKIDQVTAAATDRQKQLESLEKLQIEAKNLCQK